MKYNIPIADRLAHMIRAKSHDNSDPLRSLLFSSVTNFVTDCKQKCQVHDAISDAYVYISNDRKNLVNAIIEAELTEQPDALSDAISELERSDCFCLKQIVEHRNTISNQ